MFPSETPSFFPLCKKNCFLHIFKRSINSTFLFKSYQKHINKKQEAGDPIVTEMGGMAADEGGNLVKWDAKKYHTINPIINHPIK